MQALRLFLVAAALRFDVSFDQAAVLVIAAVSAAAIGFLPAGLGAREGIAAVLAPASPCRDSMCSSPPKPPMTPGCR